MRLLSGILSCRVTRLAGVLLAAAMIAVWCTPTTAASADDPAESEELTINSWPKYQPIEPVPEPESPWIDVLLQPGVFTKARRDLGDLRVWDEQGRAVPYALRVLRPEYRTDPTSATVFNRADGPDRSSELSLDLGPEPLEHNEVVVDLPGENFRRRAELEGSDDANQWRQLATDLLIRFQVDRPPPASLVVEPEKCTRLEDLALSYPLSRFRYLRLRVYPDPVVDSDEPDARVPLEKVTVQRRVALPGELLTLSGKPGPRSTLRAQGAPASAWIVELGGDNVPVSRVDVEISDPSFVRDFEIEWGGPPESVRPFEPAFRTAMRGTWQRRTDDDPKPLAAEFGEVLASRLRIVVVDHGNPPLNLGDVTFTAAARQVVVPAEEATASPLRLYYGQPKAQDPQYDFERNLPDRLQPPPARTQLGEPQDNSGYEPEPLPLTERWPWLVYTVLGSVSVLLLGLLVSVGRTAVREHDLREHSPDQGT